MKKILFISLVLTTVILSSCKKGEEPPSSDTIVIAKEAKVINNQTWEDQFISIDSTNYTITFSKNISATQQFKVGDIIVSAAGEGLLRKIKSVSTVGNEIKVQTDPATITEVIQQGLIEFEQPLTVSLIKSIDYHYAGIKLNIDNAKGVEQTQFNWDINTVLYDNDGNLTTTIDQIKLIGTFNCDWLLAVRIDVGLIEGLKEVKFGFESEENLDLQLVAGIQYNSEKKVTLATVNFTPIVVTIGAIPVVFTPQLKIIAGIDGSANASVTSNITQSLSFDAGIQYLKAEGWSPYKTFNKNFSFQPPQLNMNASAGGYLKPELLIKVYAIAGPYANLKLYGRVDANLLQTPWWKLYGGIKMNAGAKVDILDKFLLEYTVSDLINYELLLTQATSPPILKPTVTTSNVTNITSNTATVGGNISTDGGASITDRGVYWGTSQNPETTGTKLQIGSGSGIFSYNLTGLSQNTTYYIRSYSTNIAGTSYGNQLSFKTQLSFGTVSDNDGNTYKTVTIGTQTWMAENLKTTKYKDGSSIPLITDDNVWKNLSTPAYCWYDNDITYKNTYGALYNWYSVNTGKICPTGWHVATKAEWTTMMNFLDDPAGNSLMESGSSHWLCPDAQANNYSGFSIVPGGGRYNLGRFNDIGYISYFWCSTEDGKVGNYRYFFRDNCNVVNNNKDQKSGFSVRCLRD